MRKRMAIAAVVYSELISALVTAQTARPEILRISPTSGPEGTRVQIIGRNLQETSAVFLGSSDSNFEIVSAEELIAVIPHKSATSTITVVTARGRAASPSAFVVSNDPRVPDEVSYKAGYVNPIPPPANFKSVLLWGIAIADTRVPGHESARVEIASTKLTCRVDGKDVILNDDRGDVRGGLYRREPWFGTDQHDPMPLIYDHAQPHRCVESRPKPRSRLAFLERVAASRTAHGQPRRLHRSKPASRFPPGPCCKWGWTIGALQLSPTALAETTTKPEPATGTSPPSNGKKPLSVTLEGLNFRQAAAKASQGQPPEVGRGEHPSPTHC